MRLPIDANHMSFICGGEPTPVVDFETKRPKLDDTGTPLYQLNVLAVSGTEAEVLTVKVPGEPKGLSVGAALRVTGLVAQPYKMTDREGKERQGLTYRATSIDPARAERAAS